MTTYCRLAYSALLLATFLSLALACTQGESEDKMTEAIYAAHDMNARNPAKAEAAAKKINQALSETRQSSTDRQAEIDKLCKALDEVLAELRR